MSIWSVPAPRWIAMALLGGAMLPALLGPSFKLTVFFGDIWAAGPPELAVATALAQVFPLWWAHRVPIWALVVVSAAFLGAQAFSLAATTADLAVFVALATVGRNRPARTAMTAAGGFTLALAAFILVAAGRSAHPLEAIVVAGAMAAIPTLLGMAFRRVAGRVVAPAVQDIPAAVSPLTAREWMVLSRVADGLTNGEIGAELHIGAETVKTHVSSILAKLGARDRTQAVTLAYRTGVLSPHPPGWGRGSQTPAWGIRHGAPHGTVADMRILLSILLSMGTTPGALVVGGEPETREHPYLASLQYEFQGDLFHACAGTLVHAEWVVTAAHCVSGSTPAVIRVGSLDRTNGGSVRGVMHVVVHPETNPTGLPHHDIALVRLSEPVPQRPARIGETVRAGSAVRLLGWGMTCAASTPADPCPIPTVVQRFDTRVLADRSPACQHDGRMTLDPRTELCTRNGNPGGPCFADSGGPALTLVAGRWRVVGATSRLVNLPCGHAPAIYTDVSAYSRWISGVTNTQ